MLHPGIPFTSVIAAGCNITHTAFTHELLSSPGALIIGKGSMSTEQGDDISGHMGNGSAFCFYKCPLVGGGHLRPQKLAQATATSESALAFDLGKSSEPLS